MFYTSYLRERAALLLTYLIVDIVLAALIANYFCPIVDFKSVLKILVIIVSIHFAYDLRNCIVKGIFWFLYRKDMIASLVNEFSRKGYPKTRNFYTSPSAYFEKIASDSSNSTDLRMHAQSWINQLQFLSASSHGYVRFFFHEQLIQSALNQYFDQ